jgi:hypothetical protein
MKRLKTGYFPFSDHGTKLAVLLSEHPRRLLMISRAIKRD